jgi:hypothetical protein
MSPRAACRLEQLGFERVYDYVGGIADWRAAGLPVEGSGKHGLRVADATSKGVPTCHVGGRVGEVRDRARAAGWETCVVVAGDGVVVGRLRSPAWDSDLDATVGEVMEPGPSTVRPDAALEPLVGRMRKEGYASGSRHRSAGGSSSGCSSSKTATLWSVPIRVRSWMRMRRLC